MTNKNVLSYFLIGQFSLFFCIAICILLIPQGLTANDGISYYSGHMLTIIPYSIGLLAIAWCSYKLAGLLPDNSNTMGRFGFNSIAILLLAIVITPYGINFAFEYVHTLLSALLFFVQFSMVWWFAFKVKADAISLFLLLLLALEMIFTVMYLSPQKGYLLQGEVAFQLTFAIVAYRSILYIVKPGHGKTSRGSYFLSQNARVNNK